MFVVGAATATPRIRIGTNAKVVQRASYLGSGVIAREIRITRVLDIPRKGRGVCCLLPCPAFGPVSKIRLLVRFPMVEKWTNGIRYVRDVESMADRVSCKS